MSVITLSSYGDDQVAVDYSFQPDTWYEALDHYVKFLRAQGYAIKNDSILINLAAGHFIDTDAKYEINNVGVVDMGALQLKD